MNSIPEDKKNIIVHWIENLVGTGPRFTFNLLITLFGGVLYSFKIWNTIFVFIIFGVISPLIFTLCVYFLVKFYGEIDEDTFPRFLTSKGSNTMFMIFDMSIIIILAVLIQLGILNYLFFRLLQTVIFPVVMLFMLRILYLGVFHNSED